MCSPSVSSSGSEKSDESYEANITGICTSELKEKFLAGAKKINSWTSPKLFDRAGPADTVSSTQKFRVVSSTQKFQVQQHRQNVSIRQIVRVLKTPIKDQLRICESGPRIHASFALPTCLVWSIWGFLRGFICKTQSWCVSWLPGPRIAFWN